MTIFWVNKKIELFTTFTLLIMNFANSMEMSYPTTISTEGYTTGQAATCKSCPSSLKYPLLNVTLQEIIDMSPLIVPLEQRNQFSKDDASRCITFLQLQPNLALAFVTITNIDGSYYVEVFFILNGSQGPGSLELVGVAGRNVYSAALYYGYAVDLSCPSCSNLLGIIVDLEAQDCNDQGGYINPYTAITNTTSSEDCCLSKAKEVLESFSGMGTIRDLPMSQTINCVSTFKSLTVVNADGAFMDNPQINAVDYP